MGDAVYFWTGGVDRVMDHVGGFVEKSYLSTLDDITFVVDQKEVFGLEKWPGNAEGVDPK